MRLNGHTGAVTALQIARVEDELTAGSRVYLLSAAKDGVVKVWDQEQEQSVQTISSGHSEVTCMYYL